MKYTAENWADYLDDDGAFHLSCAATEEGGDWEYPKDARRCRYALVSSWAAKAIRGERYGLRAWREKATDKDASDLIAWLREGAREVLEDGAMVEWREGVTWLANRLEHLRKRGEA